MWLVFIWLCTYFVVMEDHEIHRLGHANDQTSLALWFRLILRKKKNWRSDGCQKCSAWVWHAWCPPGCERHVVLPDLTGMSSQVWQAYCPTGSDKQAVLSGLTGMLSSWVWQVYCPSGYDRHGVLLCLIGMLSTWVCWTCYPPGSDRHVVHLGMTDMSSWVW